MRLIPGTLVVTQVDRGQIPRGTRMQVLWRKPATFTHPERWACWRIGRTYDGGQVDVTGVYTAEELAEVGGQGSLLLQEVA